jgi:hypothetical protein
MLATRLVNSPLKAVVPLCTFALLLTGCATVTDLGGFQRTGYQDDGSYVLSAREEEMGCRALKERQQGLQAQMQQLSARAVKEMQELPQTVASAWGRMFGSPGQGVPSVAEYNEARAETAALNATLARKGCASSIETATIKR